MQRVCSLYLPQLPVERLWRAERSATRPEPRAALRLPLPAIDDEPGACSVPRGSGWRPGARWARDEQVHAIAALPRHQQPPMREMGRRSEHAEHPFRAMPADEGAPPAAASLPAPTLQGRRPLVLIETVGQCEIVTAACPLALAIGLTVGMPAAQARAIVADLDVRNADPAADTALLERIAHHAVRHWTPVANIDPPAGLWLDLTGTTHLFGGEARFCERVLAFFARLGLTVRIGVAGTPGAAHAVARWSASAVTLVPPGREREALAPFPAMALRLAPAAVHAAARFGLDTIGDLYPLPRGPLARRLGATALERLDQALGAVREPIVPLVPFAMPEAERRLLEPIATPEAIGQVIGDLATDLARRLDERGLGLRAALLTLARVDGADQRIAFGTSLATRDARHLARLAQMRIERIEPGLGIEAMRLAAPHVEPLAARSIVAAFDDMRRRCPLAHSIDTLVGRAGEHAVFRIAPRESDVPERAVVRAGALDTPAGWPGWARPVRLLARPERLTGVIALLPDHPPRRFVWRGEQCRVVAGDGPERVHGEWWRTESEMWAVRDYFRVEDDRGRRFWLFRRGDGVEDKTGDLSWYMHGLFG